MSTTTRFQTGKLPAIMEDGDWTADSTLSLTGTDGNELQYSWSLTLYKGAGGQYYAYGTRSSARGEQTKLAGYYAEDATTVATIIGNMCRDLNVDPKLNAEQRLLAAATGAAIDGAA